VRWRAIVAAGAIARTLLLSTFDTSHGDAVVGTIWDAYLGDLRLWALAAGVCGLIAAALVEPARPEWWRALVVPAGAGARLAWAAGLLTVAALLIAAPAVPLDLALVAAAGALVFSAASEIARLTAH
jgi:hypothetical protein